MYSSECKERVAIVLDEIINEMKLHGKRVELVSTYIN